MNITFYKNLTEKNRIGKTLDDPLALTGTLRDECSIINPSISIEADNMSGYNYCYIPDFGRYYFIVNSTVVRNNLWRIDLHVDVLESFKNQLLLQNIIVDKQSALSNSNELYNDGSYIVQSNTVIEVAAFTSNFSDEGEFILLTAGAF